MLLRVHAYNGAFSKEEFDEFFVKPVQKEFPYIDLEYVSGNPQELVVANQFPDIGMTGIGAITNLNEMGVMMAHDELVKTYNLDLSQYAGDTISYIRSYSDAGELLALPMWINNYVSLYNKDIFDLFGVSYPEDGLTWDEMRDLAALITRAYEGVTYKGYAFGNFYHIGEGLGLSVVDGDKAAINTDGWKRVLNIANSILSIEGNEPRNVNGLYDDIDQGFFSDNNVAMISYYGSRLTKAAQMTQDQVLQFDWDVTTYPVHAEYPDRGPKLDAQVYYVSSTSEHKDDAFRVIQFMTTNHEVQSNIARLGKARPAIEMDLNELVSIFGTDYPVLKEKNLAGLFKVFPNTEVMTTQYDSLVRSALAEAFVAVINGEMDVNTALNMAEEKANQAIAEAMKNN